MKSITYTLAMVTGMTVLTTLGLSQSANAQRFNRNESQRTFAPVSAPRAEMARPMPVARPQVNRPAPQPFHMAQQPVAQRPPMQQPLFAQHPPIQQPPAARMSLQNDNRSFGREAPGADNRDHRDLAWNNPRPSRPGYDGNVHVSVNTHVNVHENIFHTGGRRDLRPYAYHPYRPFYWGPTWHPVGFFLNALTADAFRISIANQWYYYDAGTYYIPSGSGYSVVPPPVGAIISDLPDGYESTMVGNDMYYYYAGAFYLPVEQGYEVVNAPVGAVITQLPAGAVDEQIDGQDILVYNHVSYAPIQINGQDAYQVIQCD